MAKSNSALPIILLGGGALALLAMGGKKSTPVGPSPEPGPGPGPSPSPRPSPTPSNDPPRPDKGAYDEEFFKNARSIREVLRELGYNVAINDQPLTSNADKAVVRTFQSDYNEFSESVDKKTFGKVAEDGIIGPKTLNALQAAALHERQFNRGYSFNDAFGGTPPSGSDTKPGDTTTKPTTDTKPTTTDDAETCRRLLASFKNPYNVQDLPAAIRAFQGHYNSFVSWYNYRVQPSRKKSKLTIDGKCSSATQAALNFAKEIDNRGGYKVENSTEPLDSLSGNWGLVHPQTQAWQATWGSY
jgi:hypothetical protein